MCHFPIAVLSEFDPLPVGTMLGLGMHDVPVDELDVPNVLTAVLATAAACFALSSSAACNICAIVAPAWIFSLSFSSLSADTPGNGPMDHVRTLSEVLSSLTRSGTAAPGPFHGL